MRRVWARGSMDNVIVVDDYRVLNADGLRHDDEVRGAQKSSTPWVTCTWPASR